MLPLLGGALIGLSVSLLLFTHGRAAGISGLYAGLFNPSATDRSFRLLFFAGLVAGGVAMYVAMPSAFAGPVSGTFITAGLAGLLVGYGTRLGGGCTSGHGVCGISRFDVRSIVATVTFMAAGIATVAAVRWLGGAP